jgi:transposase
MATQYYSSVIIRKHLEENKNAISINYLPKGSPDYNAAEEGWKQGKEG